MAPEPRLFYYGYQDILALVDKNTTKDIMMDCKRKGLDPEKLEDVILYVAQHGRFDLRVQIGAASMKEPEVLKALREASPQAKRRKRKPPVSNGR